MSSNTGIDARTIVIHCVDRLREKFPASQSLDELLTFALPEHKRQDTGLVNLIKTFLRVNPKANWNASSDTYRFRPLHNISSPEELLGYFQKQETALGLVVRDLKEGWPDAEEGIDKLEAENKLLVTRNKKDGHPRMVWPNDPSLIAPLDQEFKDLWAQISLPLPDDVIKELIRMNHTPTGELQKADLAARPEKKKKKVRRGAKVTNVHMQDMFRDYSSKRPQGR